MSAAAFLKRNFVAVLGVALPLLLVLILVASRSFTVSRVAPPAHDLLLVANSYNNALLEFRVEQGKLIVRYMPAKESTGVRARSTPELLYLDVSRQAVRPITIELPVDEDGLLSQKAQPIEVPELADLTLSAESVSPDGYRFERAQRSGGLFHDLFGGRSRYQYVLAKDGRRIALPDTEQRYNVTLVAWVTEK